MYTLGIDIGYSAVKVAVIDQDSNLKFQKYVLHKGNPKKVLKEFLEEVVSHYSIESIKYGAITGTGGMFIQGIGGVEAVNEITSVVEGTAKLNKNIGSIIEIGGQSAKFITEFNGDDKSKIKFATNTDCSAGTGSFLEEQASRLNLGLEDYSEYTDRATSIPRIAGRCSVFAKTDIIHHQQEGKSVEDILLGLSYAVIRNYKNAVIRNLSINKPVIFVGGVAQNNGIIRAMKEILELTDEELVISESFDVIGALGAAIIAQREKQIIDLAKLLNNLNSNKKVVFKSSLEFPELDGFGSGDSLNKHNTIGIDLSKVPIKCYLGVDIGSTSTNLVLINENNEVITYRYLKTLGKPIETVKQGLLDLQQEVGDNVEIIGVGTTGSGRYMVGDLIGADVVRDEITAQAKAAIAIDPTVDTIFEIGGQDSKYIRIKDGVVVDFEMNKVCAAGTGSFIEEQAKKTGIAVEDFGKVALSSENPLNLGERCTVFIETNIADNLAKGAEISDIASGLSYSIVKNYLNRVVGPKEIGKKVFFQGGVTHNQGVVNAFRAMLGDRIFIPPFFSVTGAMGVAIIAKEELEGTTRFKGFDIDKVKYDITDIKCNRCSNICMVKKITFEGDTTPRFYGARCDIFEREFKPVTKAEDNIFTEIDKLYMKGYERELDPNKKTVGVPRVLFMNEVFPAFNIFFRELGYNVILSEPTSEDTIKLAQKYSLYETCYPIKLVNGHVAQLIEQKIDYLFLPSLYTMKHEVSKARQDFSCSYMQSLPQIVEHVMKLKEKNIKLLGPALSFNFGKSYMMETMLELGKSLGQNPIKTGLALKKGLMHIEKLEKEKEKLGEDLVKSLNPGEKAFVIISRNYGIVDPGLNMKIPNKLMEMGYKVLPLSALPAHDHDIFAEHPNMYWPFGQHILSGAQIVKQHPNLYAIYLTNHGCGPDTAISHFFSEEMGEKPYLHIEVDEHSSSVGIITRVEAFVNSLKHRPSSFEKVKTLKNYSDTVVHKETNIEKAFLGSAAKDHKLYIPYLYPYSHIFAEVLKRRNLDAEVLPITDFASIDVGRGFTITKEYFSLTATFGDVFRQLKNNNINKNIGFFIPTNEGSEVHGQYHRLIRTKLDLNGYKDVKVISPFVEDLILEDDSFVETLTLGLLAGDLIKASGFANQEKYLSKILKALSENKLDFGMIDDMAQQIYFENKANGSKKSVAIIGEPKILFNDFMNNNYLKRINDKGINTLMEPLSEVMWFTWNEALTNAKRTKKRKEASLMEKRLNILKNRISRLESILKEQSPFEADLDSIVSSADSVMKYYAGGMGRYRIGKLLTVSQRVNGILNLSSLYENTTTVINILYRGFEKKVSVPYLDLAFDGKQNKNDDIRLDSFMYYL